MTKKITARFPIVAMLACLAAQVSYAQDIPDNVLSAEFRSGWQTESGTQMAALHLTLAPGWKTYWRAPGESGIPPRFDWTGSENIASATFHWPKPEIFDLNGLRTIGYKNELVLPIEFRPIKAGAPMVAVAEVELGVCEEVCIPMTVDLSQALTPTTKQDPVIRAALSQVPEPAASAGLSIAKCSVEPIHDGMRLTSDLTLPRLGPAEFVVIELTDQAVWVSTAETSRSGGLLTSVADLVPPNAQPFALDRSDIRITVFGGSGRIIDLQGCPG